jgi:general L-amino acid transport system permease protein
VSAAALEPGSRAAETTAAAVLGAEGAFAPSMPPRRRKRPWSALFGTPFNTAVTLACLALAALALPPLWDWAIGSAVFSGDARACRAPGAGACWAFVAEKLPFMLFGFYPPGEQWRPLAVVVIFLVAMGASLRPAAWRPALGLVWIAVIGLFYWLLGGGLGLSPQPTRVWGGLPVTILLSTVGLGLAFPMGIALALGRTSRLPLIRLMSVAYIELIRGVPLISLLFMASVVFPLFLPEGVSLDKLVRAQAAFTLFAAAYLAEIVRGGLQGIGRGQYEAADALGLDYARKMGLVVLPQALRLVIPALISTFIGFFKDTTLVVVVGIFDFMTAIRAALSDPNWLGFAPEAYAFAAAVYFVLCFGLSRYGLSIERHFRLRAH